MADFRHLIVTARALRQEGDELVDEYRAHGLTAGLTLNVLAFLKQEEALREAMDTEKVDDATAQAMMEDLQRIADVRQQFEELYKDIDAMTKGRMN